MSILVVRPEPHCSRTCAYLACNGLQASPIPLIDIVTKPLPSALIYHSLHEAKLLIALSVNAVRPLKYYQSALQKQTPVIAVGNSTKKALQPFFDEVKMPEEHNSEGIIDLLKSEYKATNVTLLKGLGGRDILPQYLQMAGYSVKSLPLYERRPSNSFDSAKFNWSNFRYIVVTSIEMASAALSKLPKETLSRSHWIALSPRIAKFLQDKGMVSVDICKGTDDTDILNTLQKLN